MSFSESLNYILKLMELKQQGYDVIENVPFEIVEEEETHDLTCN